MAGFLGLETALRAVQANQKAIEVTGHNIANANTEGYNRQRVQFSETAPFTSPAYNQYTGAGQLGTGVTIEQIVRVRENFTDLMYRANVRGQASWDAKNDVLGRVEGIVAETSGAGLTSQLNEFFYAWQEMSKDPNMNNRSILLEKSKGLVSFFRDLSGELSQLARDTDRIISGKVSEVNNLAAQIVDLNREIMKVERGRQVQGPNGDSIVQRENNANDLRDKRDLLLDKLAKYGTISVTEDGVTGMVSVTLGDSQLVNGNSGATLTTGTDPQGHVVVKANLGQGEIAGYLEAREVGLKQVQSNLDMLAAELISQVNNLHRQGVDAAGQMGGVFFSGSGAADIDLTAAVAADAKKIAAAKPPAGYPAVFPASGDGSNALAIFNLQNTLAPRAGGLVDPASHDSKQTLAGFWRDTVFSLGLQVKQAKDNGKNQGLLVQQAENKRLEVAGVSLDEEMTNLVKFQHGYNAAARIITVIDEMLETIVNRLGTAGR